MDNKSLRIGSALLISLSLLGFASAAHAETPEGCAPLPEAPAAVAQAVRDMFGALSREDAGGFRDSTTEGFFAYDAGQNMSAATLWNIVKDGRAAGAAYVWTVHEAKVQAVCDLATIAYVNRGSVRDAAGEHPVVWLESAVLRYEGRRWRVAFLHSSLAKSK